MDRPLIAILLAGRIRPSPLSRLLDVPSLCLPVGRHGTLLDEWLVKLSELESLTNVQVVVNTAEEVGAVRTGIRSALSTTIGAKRVRVIAEPAAWRGAAGIVRDVAGDALPNAIVLVCEAKRLPPPSLEPLVKTAASDACAGVVGVCCDGQPAGAYAFSRESLEAIPGIGYFDLKEQFLPALYRNNLVVKSVALCDNAHRVHDLQSYIDCVTHSLQDESGGLLRISKQASISPSAIMTGSCIVEAGAIVEDGAVLHDSVVLWGATVGGGAVVSRSVIGSLANVPPRSRIVQDVLVRPKDERSAEAIQEWNEPRIFMRAEEERTTP